MDLEGGRMLAGVISYGPKTCKEEGTPAVYTK